MTNFAALDGILYRRRMRLRRRESLAPLRVELENLPLRESEWRRPRLFRPYHIVLLGWPPPRQRLQQLHIPFGWAREHMLDRNAVEVGPAWFIYPRRWYRNLRWYFYHYAIAFGAAREPHPYALFSELEWFPRNPGADRY